MTKTSESHIVSEPQDTAEVRLDSGVATVVRRYGREDGTRILLSHGNGLAADAYYPFWSLFLDDFEVVVYDCRNHGWNPVGNPDDHNPQVFAEDLDRAILPGVQDAFGQKPTVGCFHSLSALVGLLLPSRGADFSGLLLYDPPVCRPGMQQQHFDSQVEQVAHALRIRQEDFDNHEQFVDLSETSPMLRGIDRRTLRLLAETTLRPRADGPGYALRCPPAYEAQAMQFITAYAVLVDIKKMECPVKVIGGDPTAPFAYLPSVDPELVMTVDYDFVPDCGHYLQLQRPDICHALAMDFLRLIAMI
ncbi:MAG: alpha/beta hydrolase [Acidobacteria bacterium]|nr:alpha/beta hydrolase [Acidobacteriota bacterium]